MTITIPRALLEQALEALTCNLHPTWIGLPQTVEAIRAELAKPKRCDLCGYQHGHQIGCANNPVDIALSRQALRAEPAKPATAPKASTFIRERAQLEQEWCVLKGMQQQYKNLPSWHDAPETIALQLELASAKESYLNACKLVADMHAAAVGEVTGPRLGVVEDVAALKAERDRYRKALESMTRKEPCDCGCPSGKKAVILKPAHYYAIAAEALKGDAAIAKAEGREE